MAIPIGSVVNYSLAGPPADLGETWLLCDGSAVKRDSYGKLKDLIGGNFGEGDGKNTFNLPDLLGRFVRATDQSPAAGPTGRDPDAGARTAMNFGGNEGNQ